MTTFKMLSVCDIIFKRCLVVIIFECYLLFVTTFKTLSVFDIIAPKEHSLTPNWTVFVRACIRAHERTSRWKILFTSYLGVELSPGAGIWCVYATSINDCTQILTFLGIQNNRDFRILDFSVGM